MSGDTVQIDAQASLAEGIELHRGGRLNEAIAIYQKILEAHPTHFDAIHLLGVAAYQLGQYSLAIKLISSAIQLNPHFAEAYYNLGNAFVDDSKPLESLQYFLKAIELRPDYLEAYVKLGNALIASIRNDDAKACFFHALNLKPGCAAAYVGLGGAYLGEHQLLLAEEAFLKALEIEPDNADAVHGLSVVKLERGNPEDAAHFIEELKKHPSKSKEAEYLNSLLLQRSRPESNLREFYYHGGMMEEAEALAREELKRVNSVDNHNFLLKCYLASPDANALQYFEESRSWSKIYANEELLPAASDFDLARVADKRLRVGIVGDYFDSVIGKYTLYPFFRQYDREKIELYCYNFGEGADEIRPIVDRYYDIRKLNSQQFYERVRSDRIDIMLDINGRLRTPNFFDALLRQPAPIIVNWYNLTATVGVKAYNYLIADDFSVRPEDESLYVEKVFRMPNGTISSWDLGEPPRVPEPPLVRNGYPTFGCFGDFFKVNKRVMAAWADLLKRVPQSRLYLKSKNLRSLSERERVAEFFRSQGISDERLMLEGPSPYPIMKKLYELVDVALDTFPYSSGSSTINALWQGVPVVTIAGGSWRERNTASILVGASLEQYIANDLDGYMQKAMALADDVGHLRYLRSHLAEYLVTTPQWQTRDFAVNFESRLRMIWKDWLANNN